MSPWSQYNEAILAILSIVKKTVPLTGVERRRIDEAEELVDAIIDIIALEEAADDDIEGGVRPVPGEQIGVNGGQADTARGGEGPRAHLGGGMGRDQDGRDHDAPRPQLREQLQPVHAGEIQVDHKAAAPFWQLGGQGAFGIAAWDDAKALEFEGEGE